MAEDGERPRKVRRLASGMPKLGRMITVCVGKGKKLRNFYIHEEKLIDHSDFFKAALSGDRWLEGTERKVSLPEDKPDAFEGFQCFLYSGVIIGQDPAQIELQKDGLTSDQEYETISNAWVLADKLQSCSYKDAMTDNLAIKVVAEAAVPLDMQNVFADGTSMSVGMARLLVDVAIRHWTVQGFEKLDLDRAPKTFVRKLLVGLAETKDRSAKETPWLKEDCHYHDHGEDKPCYKTMFTY
ncbi:hypothetical protein LTR56_027395 [Elasticomyces elasticus]|nr:hypothetical protein LTR56_027395 [Elasticomyces elasticus]KAK3633184.1 hypothetical protein LTR22_020260 [Elasticomyces elasticus]KAK4922371.1 hypothetical protein LTR49_010236 [Elasticomyces elasticus]KAK5765252.1 hypothetical protein LTS12_004509 [Elasticomyces elasticus]